MNRIYLGVDLGQAQDPTAFAVVERAELRGDWDAAQYAWRKVVAVRLRMLSRVPLGTPYPEVVQRIGQLTRSSKFAGAPVSLAVDGTGVGRPVVDLLREERLRVKLMPVMVTSGAQESYTDGYYYVPKRDLIASLQVRFQQGRLQIAAGLAFGRELVEELRAMEVRTTPSGREQYGAWRTGTHDDLVFAVSLACWSMKEGRPRLEDQYWLDRREAERAEVFKKAVDGVGVCG